MIRKLVLSAVIATATLTGLSLTPTAAEAAAPLHRRFEVLVECGRCWEVRGVYHNRFEAERAAHHFRHEGFRVQIREC
ncbi:hypothetical protein [Frigoriglobus tundricola]|uniref:Uncharacterized protein n=1 Tax=Frigoriglobus tundricola TaxID=2774151 RepID=A0A6M5Z195_9BACT|nr:hypothetical protein [Frigoriglobus tundricola]QJW99938.1 hypothetical protein FTUN_7561 [Frigoriglobus tundricola]